MEKETRNDRLICELCDTEVTVISKQDGQGAGSIWVCKDCDVKYPRIDD
tara:strand:- start:559 stop:705 length:147 start_codon:yes stop_codon:yes gene_type:complete